MISCPQCETSNSLDSAFCKKCGGALSADARAAMREKLAADLEGAQRLAQEGRTDDALLLIGSLLESDPELSGAWALRASLHERQGDLSEALECYERALALEPDATLEKLKAKQLRNRLTQTAEEPVAPARAVPLWGAAAAVAVMIGVGILAGTLRAQGREPSPEGGQAVQDTEVQRGFRFSQPVQTVAPTPSGLSEAQGAPPATTMPQPVPQMAVPRAQLPADGRLPLPSINGVEVLQQEATAPVNPFGNIQLNPVEPPAQTVARVDPDPVPVAVEPPPVKRPAGTIDIRLSEGEGEPPTQGGGQSVETSENGVRALLEVATNQYMRQDFRGAAATYERALRAGADPASTNEQLARCYSKLGLISDAKSAYGKAIAAYEAHLKRRPANSTRLEAALEACRQALRVLEGGS